MGTNRRAGPAESMTIRVLTEVLEIGERITNILNAHDLSLRIRHVCVFTLLGIDKVQVELYAEDFLVHIHKKVNALLGHIKHWVRPTRGRPQVPKMLHFSQISFLGKVESTTGTEVII